MMEQKKINLYVNNKLEIIIVGLNLNSMYITR